MFRRVWSIPDIVDRKSRILEAPTGSSEGFRIFLPLETVSWSSRRRSPFFESYREAEAIIILEVIRISPSLYHVDDRLKQLVRRLGQPGGGLKCTFEFQEIHHFLFDRNP